MVVGLSLRKWCEVVRGLGLFEVLGSIILVGGLSSVWCGGSRYAKMRVHGARQGCGLGDNIGGRGFSGPRNGII